MLQFIGWKPKNNINDKLQVARYTLPVASANWQLAIEIELN